MGDATMNQQAEQRDRMHRVLSNFNQFEVYRLEDGDF